MFLFNSEWYKKLLPALAIILSFTFELKIVQLLKTIELTKKINIKIGFLIFKKINKFYNKFINSVLKC